MSNSTHTLRKSTLARTKTNDLKCRFTSHNIIFDTVIFCCYFYFIWGGG